MIKTELLGNGLVRHYSDDGHDLLQEQTGNVYREAVDVMPCRYTYAEVERRPEPEPEEPVPDAQTLAEEAYLMAAANDILIREVLS